MPDHPRWKVRRTVMGSLVGRRSELRRIAAAIDEGGPGMVLAGPAGVGKTRLALETIGALDRRRFRPAQASANSASRSIPFGALAHLLPPDESPDVPDPLGWALASIRETGDGPDSSRRLVLSVDDAHLLDDASAAVVDQLVSGNDAFVLITTRSGEPAPDTVVSLWNDGPLERVELSALSLDDSTELIRTELGGQVDSGTAHRLWRVTAGNPLYLRELLLAIRDAGTLIERYGVFRWSGEVAMAPRLTELIGSRLSELDDAETSALEYVAFAEPVEVNELAAVAPPEAIDSIEARHLVMTESDTRQQWVRLAHPLYGEGVRARCPELRAQRRMRDLAENLEASGPRGPDDILRLAIWRLESGTTHDSDATLVACRIAWAAGDMPLATRLGQAALDAGGDVDAAITLASILNWRAHFHDALTVLATAESRVATDAQCARLAAARAFSTAYGRGSVDDALDVLERAGEALDEPAPQLTLAAMRAEVLVTAGRATPALPDFEALLAEPELPLGARLQARLLTGIGYAVAGRRARALTHFGHAARLPESWRSQVPNEVPRQAFLRYYAHLVAGALDAADTAVAELRGLGSHEWRWDFGLGVLGLSGAQLARVRGRVGEAERRSREAAVALHSTGHTFAPSCLAELAHAEALSGQPESSRSDLARADRQRTPGFELFYFWIDIARTWVLACGGDVPAAIDHAIGTAQRAHDAGLAAYAVIAVHDAVRLGAADRAAELIVAATHAAEGPYAAACAAHHTALTAADGDALLTAADRFSDLGMTLYAAEAAAQAAVAFHTRDQAARARAAGAKAWSLAEHCEGARTPALADLRAPGLTPAEREVAHLAAGGLTSREIADRLGRSVRTIDNHLAHAYDKLGVHSRRDLADLLR